MTDCTVRPCRGRASCASARPAASAAATSTKRRTLSDIAHRARPIGATGRLYAMHAVLGDDACDSSTHPDHDALAIEHVGEIVRRKGCRKFLHQRQVDGTAKHGRAFGALDLWVGDR